MKKDKFKVGDKIKCHLRFSSNVRYGIITGELKNSFKCNSLDKDGNIIGSTFKITKGDKYGYGAGKQVGTNSVTSIRWWEKLPNIHDNVIERNYG